jgi:hypothetical protein
MAAQSRNVLGWRANDELRELLRQTSELAHAVVHACPDDKADLYVKLGLRMTYYLQKTLVEARVVPASTCANGLCPRGDHNHLHILAPPPIGDVYRIPVG